MEEVGAVRAPGEEAEAPKHGSARRDCAAIMRLGWPNSVNAIVEFAPGFVMLSFLGSNVEHLAAAGMGFMYANVTGISFIIGFGAGAQPLVSQAFGAGNWSRCGDLLQRQLAIHLIVVLAVAIVWYRAEAILLAARQPAHVAALTAQFVLWRLPALPFLVVKEDLKVFCQAQNVMVMPMILSVISNGASVFGFAPLIARFGFVGAPLSLSLGNALQAVLMYLLSHRVLPQPEVWPRWSFRSACREWGEILKLSLPGGALMLCEWWGWEINLFFAGLLCTGDDGCLELDVFPILSNTMVIGFMVHFGFSIAAGTRCGNSLGAGDHITARRTAHVALVLVGFISAAIALAVVALRWEWAFLFTDDPGVVRLTAEVLPMISMYIFLDALGPGALVAVLRSMGVVRLPALMNFVSFYVVGIPVGLWLTFSHSGPRWGVFGLWSGLVLGMLTMVTSLLAFLLGVVDWRAVADEAQARAKALDASPEAECEQGPGVPAVADAGASKPGHGKKKRAYAPVLSDDGAEGPAPSAAKRGQGEGGEVGMEATISPTSMATCSPASSLDAIE